MSKEDPPYSPAPSVSKEAAFLEAQPVVVVNEKRLLRKLDAHLLPIVTILYLLSFLDRGNIGNAKLAGLTKDLKLVGLQYNICTMAFFVMYAFVEVPSNMAMKFIRPSLWIPLIMFLWGIVMLAMAFVKSFQGLLVARIFLGVTEAGLFPGVTFYLCLWYPRLELAARIAIFFSAATLAGAFGGLLAYGIEQMNGIGGLAGWSWIFLLEGLVTVVVAVISHFFMHDYPETASFLEEEERRYLVQRLEEDNTRLSKRFDWKFFWQAVKDPKAYLFVVMYMGTVIPAFSFSLFVPTIIAGLGYSNSRAQLLSVPPFVLACALTVGCGRLSDRLKMRGPFVLGGPLVAIVGYIILYATSSPGAGYAAVFIAAAGLFPTIPCLLGWVGNNAGGEVKRAVVLGIVIGAGNLGGIASSFIYRAQDSPRYHPGHGTVIGCLCVTIVTSAVTMLQFARLNRAKDARQENIQKETMDSFKDMGDDSPLYRYTL